MDIRDPYAKLVVLILLNAIIFSLTTSVLTVLEIYGPLAGVGFAKHSLPAFISGMLLGRIFWKIGSTCKGSEASTCFTLSIYIYVIMFSAITMWTLRDAGLQLLTAALIFLEQELIWISFYKLDHLFYFVLINLILAGMIYFYNPNFSMEPSNCRISWKRTFFK